MLADDPSIYFDRREEGNFIWCSPIQTYLELNQGSKREQETAENIRKKILNEVNERLEVD